MTINEISAIIRIALWIGVIVGGLVCGRHVIALTGTLGVVANFAAGFGYPVIVALVGTPLVAMCALLLFELGAHTGKRPPLSIKRSGRSKS